MLDFRRRDMLCSIAGGRSDCAGRVLGRLLDLHSPDAATMLADAAETTAQDDAAGTLGPGPAGLGRAAVNAGVPQSDLRDLQRIRHELGDGQVAAALLLGGERLRLCVTDSHV